jgi:Zn-finger nucleic acid-binding protein
MRCPNCNVAMKEQVDKEKRHTLWICPKCRKVFGLKGKKLIEWRS